MTDPVATEEIFPCMRADAESDLGYVGGHGRTKPVLMSVRDADDNTTDCVVKLAGHLTEAPLEYLCEWVSWAVARRVGVGCPDMRAVTISPAFAAQLRTDPPSVAGQSVGAAVSRGSSTRAEACLFPHDSPHDSQAYARTCS